MDGGSTGAVGGLDTAEPESGVDDCGGDCGVVAGDCVGGVAPESAAVSPDDPPQAVRRSASAQAVTIARGNARKPVEFILKDPRPLEELLARPTSATGHPAPKGKVKGLNRRACRIGRVRLNVTHDRK